MKHDNKHSGCKILHWFKKSFLSLTFFVEVLQIRHIIEKQTNKKKLSKHKDKKNLDICIKQKNW